MPSSDSPVPVILLRGKYYPESAWWGAMTEAGMGHIDRVLPRTSNLRAIGRTLMTLRTPAVAQTVIRQAADLLAASGTGIAPEDFKDTPLVVAVLPV